MLSFTREAMSAIKPITPVVEVAPAPPAPVVPDDPIWITTQEGAVSVYGAKMIAKKDIQIIAAALNSPQVMEEGHNCRIIVLRDDDMPRTFDDVALMGAADPNFKAISLNLCEIMLAAITEMQREPAYSLLCDWHHQFHIVVLHELHHLMRGHVRNADEVVNKERCADADAWAQDLLFWLAKNVNIEPANVAEAPFVLEHIKEAIDCMPEGAMKEQQKRQFLNHIMCTVAEGADPVKEPREDITSFKTVMHVVSRDPGDDAEWLKNTNGIPAGEQWVRDQIGNLDITPAGSTQAVITEQPGDDWVPEYEPDAFVAPVAVVGGYNPTNLFGPMVAPAANTVYQPVTTAPVITTTVPVIPIMTAPVMDDARVAQIIHGLYNKCRDFIFTNCGQLVNSDLGFNNPEAVLHHPIPLTPEEAAVCVACDTLDGQGRWCPGTPTAQTGLRGKVMKNAKLPAYSLWLKTAAGIEKRLILAQNPANNSSTGRQAKAGHRICFIYEGDQAKKDALEAQKKYSSMYYKSVDLAPWEKCV